ncbi:hypothetical protein DIPPA_13598 [Diplonema papillatum]|nr:hypothetical protein DIPPA_13598 [Diplonema papillatum]|eukprot:gene5618-8567_t
MRRGAVIALALGAAVVHGQTPCQGGLQPCRDSVASTNAAGKVTDHEGWSTSAAQEGVQRGICTGRMLACYEEKADCEKLDSCAPEATLCVMLAAVTAFGPYDTAECRGYVACLQNQGADLCMSVYGDAISLAGCEARADCALVPELAQKKLSDPPCEWQTVAACRDSSDCTWSQKSRKCWPDSGTDEEVHETILIVVSFLLLVVVVAACVFYVHQQYTRDKEQANFRGGFDDNDDDDDCFQPNKHTNFNNPGNDSWIDADYSRK